MAVHVRGLYPSLWCVRPGRAIPGETVGDFAGTILGCAARFTVHYVVGATIWAAYMPDEFLGMTMTSPWTYSLLYNGSCMLLNMLLCLAAAGFLYRPLYRFLIGEDANANLNS